MLKLFILLSKSKFGHPTVMFRLISRLMASNKPVLANTPVPVNKSKKRPAWSMYPKLHDKVLEKLKENQLNHTFNPKDEEHSALKTYDTNIMGRFRCYNDECSSPGWGSKVVAITIREFSGNRYNARVYHQRCRECEKVGRLIINKSSYVDRVTYRIKKWNGVNMERPKWEEYSGPPHDRKLCEGCRLGRCKKGKSDDE
ncbi:hypothetical protein FIE12Z_783 [Fusarium flagelliforme]|uniref:3CxxC-type domain-containing protein n=1 Tax=Fusarium flagelliforme TaxID=2675880 RepID=A0A395N489_9HYPO|nr:hypothetical protein FIE12Z_783 [Fusarium flagelliforme]